MPCCGGQANPPGAGQTLVPGIAASDTAPGSRASELRNHYRGGLGGRCRRVGFKGPGDLGSTRRIRPGEGQRWRKSERKQAGRKVSLWPQQCVASMEGLQESTGAGEAPRTPLFSVP